LVVSVAVGKADKRAVAGFLRRHAGSRPAKG
jgi:hypothetical protein